MKKKLAAGLAICILWFAAGATNAAVMDFEDIDGFTNRETFPNLGIESTYGGFEWPTEADHYHWAVINNSDQYFSSVGAHSGTQALWNWNGLAERNIVFDQLYDVQGAYFNVFVANVSWGAETVQFNAFDELDNLIGSSAVLALNDSIDNPDWQWLSADFHGVSRLQIIAGDSDDYRGTWWSMDDLTLSASSASVPEPATILLLGAGLVGLVGNRIKRKRK